MKLEHRLIWSIRFVKEKLSTGTLSVRAQAGYFFVFQSVGLLFSMAAASAVLFRDSKVVRSFGMDSEGCWLCGATVLTQFVGMIYVYFRNGGANGRQFLPRFFALHFVLCVRFIVGSTLVVAKAMLLAVLLSFLNVPGALFFALMGMVGMFLLFTPVPFVLLFWRMGLHMRDVAKASALYANDVHVADVDAIGKVANGA